MSALFLTLFVAFFAAFLAFLAAILVAESVNADAVIFLARIQNNRREVLFIRAVREVLSLKAESATARIEFAVFASLFSRDEVT